MTAHLAMRWAWDESRAPALGPREGHARTYDALNRPTHAYVKHDVDDELLQERTVYGESLGGNAVTDNHRGQVYALYDTAGELIFDAAPGEDGPAGDRPIHGLHSDR